MITKELIKKIRQIEIKSSRLVEEIFSGSYHSRFKGNGIEFEDIREYYEGDDVRSIDWNVTARSDRAFVKKFREERELNMFLLVDMSSSNELGEKKRVITEIAATLAFSAVKNNDKVGALFFTDKVEKFIPAKKGKKHVLAIIEELMSEVSGKGTDINTALEHFNNFEKKRSIVFLISDFMSSGYEKRLGIVGAKHDLILIRVFEELEKKLPKGAIFVFKDLESGEEFAVDNTAKEIDLDKLIKIPGKNIIHVNTKDDYVKSLMMFFKSRS